MKTKTSLAAYKPCGKCGSYQASYNSHSYVTKYSATQHRYVTSSSWDCPNCGHVFEDNQMKLEAHKFRVIRDYGFNTLDGKRHKLVKCTICEYQTEKTYDR